MTELHESAASGNRKIVLITGCSGLLGSRISKDLRRDHLVVGLDRDEPEAALVDDWIQCDLTSDQSVEAALAALRERHGERLASVIHLAAYYDFSGEPSPLYQELTVEGTRRLLRGLQAMQVEQFVFSSSLLVQKAAREGEVIDESSPIEAEWEYPQSKVDAERVIREEGGSIPTVVLRLAGVYDEECHSIPIAQQMRRIYEKKLESYLFPGNADHGQSFVHLDDVVRCFRLVVEARGRLPREAVYLIGEEDTVTYDQLQDLLGQALHDRDWPTVRIPGAVAKIGAWFKGKVLGRDQFIKPWMIDLADAHMPISARKALLDFGWEPTRSLRTTLPEMAKRLEADPLHWYRENGLEPPRYVAREKGRTAAAARH